MEITNRQGGRAVSDGRGVPAGRGVHAGRKASAEKLAAERPAVPERTDRLTLSRQAAARLEAQSQMSLEQIRRAAETPLSRDWDWDGLGKHMASMRTCQKIAARIARGDKVPPEDERYLLERDPTGFKLAMASRRPKRKPKQWKSALTDEDKTARTVETPEAGEPESGGAET